MAEQWIIGFVVDIAKLNGVIGGDKTVVDIVEAAGGIDEKFEDPSVVEQALSEIVAGTLDEGYAQPYRHVVELIATAVGVRFYDEIHLQNWGLPDRSSWNPTLEAIGLSRLASCWGTNSSFPWNDGKYRVSWPLMTQIEVKQVTDIASEFKAFDRRGALPLALARLPVDLLSEYDDEEEAHSAREQLSKSLTTLKSWVDDAVAKELDLLLLTVGGQ